MAENQDRDYDQGLNIDSARPDRRRLEDDEMV